MLEYDEAIKHPNHYQFDGVEVMDIAKHLPFAEGNVVKYVARAGRKNDDRLSDLLKARENLNVAIEMAEREKNGYHPTLF